jgi:hypothetical protein
VGDRQRARRGRLDPQDRNGGRTGPLTLAAAHIVIVETQSAGTALSISKVLPYLVLAILIPWTILYAKRGQRQGERAEAAGRAARAATPD